MNRFMGSRKGSALIMVIVVTTIASFAVTSMVSFNTFQRQHLERIQLFEAELHAAETQVNQMIAQIAFYGVHQPYQVTQAVASGSALDIIGSQIASLTPFREGENPSDPKNGFFLRPLRNDLGFAFQIPLTEGGSIDGGDFQAVEGGRWDGYTLGQRRYRVAVRALAEERIRKNLHGGGSYRGVLVRRDVSVTLIPPYMFAIFFNGAGGIDAGPEIDIIGKVHVNGNMFMTKGGSPAWYHEHVTVAGDFFAQLWDPTNRRTDTRTGNNLRIRTRNATGNFTKGGLRFNTTEGTPNNPTQQLDSRTPNWAALAFERWGGYLRDRSHGVQPLRFPLPENVSALEILKRPDPNDIEALRNSKLSRQADIYIEGNPQDPSTLRAYNGWNPETRTEIPITTTHNSKPNVPWLTTARFYNGRERKTIHTIDINMEVLRSAITNGDVDLGAGIIYVTPDRVPGDNNLPWYAGANRFTQNAVRITNANRVPTNAQGALTIATDAPLYTRGDVNNWNSTNRALLLLAGDSINPLSNAFNDAEYDPFNTANTAAWATNIRNGLPQNNWTGNGGGREGPNRPASNTTTNAIFMGGEVSSQPQGHPNYGRYSGGGENWFRYLENWGSRDHIFNGSMLNMFESEIATASWDADAGIGTTAGYYSPPRRIWSWDPRLANIVPPPGFPNFFDISFFNWSVELPRNADGQFDPFGFN